MKYILAILAGIFLLIAGLIVYIGESNSYKYEPRYFLGYSKGENYILDTQTVLHWNIMDTLMKLNQIIYIVMEKQGF